MKAMVLDRIGPIETRPLALRDLPFPEPGPGQIRVKVSVCGLCHTELDEIEGRLEVRPPVIPGHQIVGRVESTGPDASRFGSGQRVGIAWINWACGQCDFCLAGNENLCRQFRGTGCDADGGYAEYALVSEEFAFPIPEAFSDSAAAPLLCAGAIGYRALRLTGLEDGRVLGLFGFGASAHIVIQIVKNKYRNSKVFVFTRPGQDKHQNLARQLGADWAGPTGEKPPALLHCAIDFTPAWKPIVAAMEVLERGGRLVINAIRKEAADKQSLLDLDYPRHMWLEKEIKTVANIAKRDAAEFLPLAAEVHITPKVREFALEEANDALLLLKQGKIQGAGVLRMP